MERCWILEEGEMRETCEESRERIGENSERK
jgi:hypothetical protein